MSAGGGASASGGDLGPEPARFPTEDQAFNERRPRIRGGFGRNCRCCETALTPYTLHINTGEDIVATLMSFSQQHPRAICILSASGFVLSPLLSHVSAEGYIYEVIYQGHYEMVSLSGTRLPAPSDCAGFLFVTIAVCGQILGGRAAGPLLAAAPVQVIFGISGTGSHSQVAADGQEDVYAIPWLPPPVLGIPVFPSPVPEANDGIDETNS